MPGFCVFVLALSGPLSFLPSYQLAMLGSARAVIPGCRQWHGG